MPSGKPRPKLGRPKKKITKSEREFADFMVDQNVGCIEAARKVFKWKCEPNSKQALKAVELTRAPRIKAYIESRRVKVTQEAEATGMLADIDILDMDNFRKFFYERLRTIRDDPDVGAQARYQAIMTLKKMADPSSDYNLIMMYVDLIWRGTTVHCPNCHNTFPLWKIENESLEAWHKEEEITPIDKVESLLDRRMEILHRADNRKRPHASQIIALEAPERHIAGLAGARAGKSWLLACLALIHFLIPGVEIWILARIYEDAKSEVEFLRNFIKTLFYPHSRHLVSEHYDSRTGELTISSKWGSLLKVRSAKAKGSITGRELELALVAEPGWVPEDLYEELRARMTSRLGRIILLGTPKGYTGILGRMVNMMGRDEHGRMVRIPKEQRTIAAGMPWSRSMLVYNLKVEDNPEYVKSERDAARYELTESEYASEFEGAMTSEEGAKFPLLEQRHLIKVDLSDYFNCVFVLGIDQGAKNFAACLLAFDGKRVYVVREYFFCDNNTMLYHIKELQRLVPLWIRQVGGNKNNWQLTIFDADPLVFSELQELEDDPKNKPWATPVTFRPKGKGGKNSSAATWRPRTYEYVNNLCSAKTAQLIFDENGEDVYLLHDQLIRAQNVTVDRSKDSDPNKSKGWVISKMMDRADHVCDAFIMAMWTILNGELQLTDESGTPPNNVWEEHTNMFNYNIMVSERNELQGYLPKDERMSENDMFKKNFGRKRASSWTIGGAPGYYKDES